MNNKENERIGEVNYNSHGNKMKIVKYINNKNILVEFEHGYQIASIYKYFKNGVIKSPFDKNLCNIGYSGIGNYKPYINNKKTKKYLTWEGMMKRCYDEYYSIRFPTYSNASICEEWHNFQNFAEWYDDNFYEIDGEKICLDKDILVKGNKTYSPNTCIFAPENINNLFCKSDAIRGEYPIGVTIHKPHDKYVTKYRARCMNNNKKRKDLGLYNTPNEAFQSYKTYKEHLIKQIANAYKDKIPEILYDALYKYKVEITD